MSTPTTPSHTLSFKPQGPDVGFFEGAEKELEIWFISDKSLREIPREEIDDLLLLAKCEVVDVSYTPQVDSYVLSESSLFVFDQRLILKTCGTTTLLHVVPAIVPLVAKYCGGNVRLEGLTYSRKNMEKPGEQRGVHRDFRDEIAYLDTEVGKLGYTGAGYILGRINGDHWNFYALDRNLAELEPAEETTELLMSGLDPTLARMFYHSNPDPQVLLEYAKQVTQMSGISRLLPEDAVVNPFMFYPCGYSLNAVKDKYYWTIHVTPQPLCSYASFETNYPYEDLNAAFSKVLECFQPDRFISVRFCNQAANQVRPAYKFPGKQIASYKRRDFGATSLGIYHYAFAHYLKAPSHAGLRPSASMPVLVEK